MSQLPKVLEQIQELENETSDHENRILALEESDGVTGESVPITISGTSMVVGAANVADLKNSTTYVGVDAGLNGRGATANTAVGHRAMRGHATFTGSSNTAIGYNSLPSVTTGAGNVAIAPNSAMALTTGRNNVTIGSEAGSSITVESDNIAIGSGAMTSQRGGYNVAIGRNALYASGNGSGNVAVGYESGTAITNGYNNTFIGTASGMFVTSGEFNVNIGAYVGNQLSELGSITESVSIGAFSQTTTFGIAIGYRAGSDVFDSPRSSICIGHSAGSNSTNIPQICIGTNAGQYAKSGAGIFIGGNAGQNAGLYASGICIGSGAGEYFNGTDCILIGSGAGRSTSGFSNIAIGPHALGSHDSTGMYNIAIGDRALFWDFEGELLNDITESVGIGNNTSVSGNHQIQLGNSNHTVYTYSAVQNRSDERDKTNIEDTDLGLDFITNLRPVKFQWDYRESYIDYVDEEVEYEEIRKVPKIIEKEITNEDGDIEIVSETIYEELTEAKTKTVRKAVPVPKDGSRARNRYHQGFIAQEVKEVMDNLGVDFAGYQDHSINGGKDVLSIGYQELIAPMVKAIQELSEKVVELEAKISRVEL